MHLTLSATIRSFAAAVVVLAAIVVVPVAAADVVPLSQQQHPLMFGSNFEDTGLSTVAHSCGTIIKTSQGSLLEPFQATEHKLQLSRSLQTTDDVAAACESEGLALTLCGNKTFTSADQDKACASCISSAQDATAQSRVRASNYTCESYAALSCGAVRSCNCIAPCAKEFLAYQECVLVESYKLKGVNFPCDLTCSSAPTIGIRSLVTASSTVVALMGVAATYLVSLA